MLCEYGCGNEAKYQLKNGKWCCSKSCNSCLEIKRRKFTEVGKRKRNKKNALPVKLIKEISLCDYGCGNKARYKLKNEKLCCSNSFNKCITNRKINSNSNKNKTFTYEQRKKISESKTGENNPSFGKYGDLNPNWKGGISNNPYCSIFSQKEFREIILERDGYKCLNPYCAKKYNRLNIHHINYDKKECDKRNLITLCNICNSKANADRCWHKAWYRAIIERRYCE